MGIKKDFILAALYFLILSTVLQSQDAFVFYYDSEFQPQRDTIKNSRAKMFIAFTIISLLNYFTLVLAPYFNCTIQRLALSSCVILILKYGCELAVYTRILTVVFQLGAFFTDIIGTGLFYLSSLRLVQMLCEKHQIKEKAGLCFGLATGLYALSILFGYALGFAFFQGTPAWLFLIAQACLTMVAATIAYFAFGFEFNPVVNRERQRRQAAEGNANANREQGQQQGGEQHHPQLFRDNLNFSNIFKFTLTTYTKLTPLICVQIMLGTIFAYGYALLQYLIWTSQSEAVEDKLQHNKDTMILYSLGGVFTSCLIGFICDKLPIRKLGYGLLVYNGLSLAFLYFALYIKYFYTTMLLFMFLGMTEFALLVWLLSTVSKLYKGIFEVIAANSQVIALATSAYGLGVIFFQGRMNPQTKLGIELAALIILDVVAFFFVRGLADNPVTIDYLVEELEEPADPSAVANRQRENTQVERREEPVEIEMAQRQQNLQNQIQKQQKTIDPQNLL